MHMETRFRAERATIEASIRSSLYCMPQPHRWKGGVVVNGCNTNTDNAASIFFLFFFFFNWHEWRASAKIWSINIKDNQFERGEVVSRKHNRPVAGQVAPGTLGDEDFQEYSIKKCV